MASLFGALGSLAESYGLARDRLQQNALEQVRQRIEEARQKNEERQADIATQRLAEEKQQLAFQKQEFDARQKEANNFLQDLGLPVETDPNTGAQWKTFYQPLKGEWIKRQLAGTGVTGKDSQQYIEDVSQGDPDLRRYLTTEGHRLSMENQGDQRKVLDGLGKIAGEYLKEKRTAATKSKKTPGQIAIAMAGLRSLRVNLTGGGGVEGLGDTLGVLDNWWSRKKLIIAGVGEIASSARSSGMVSEAAGKLNRLMESTAYDTMSPEEKAYIRQFKFSISTISALRPFSQAGSRSLEAMKRFIDDLPDPVSTPSSDEGRRKMALIIRDLDTIEKALNDELGTNVTPTTATPGSFGAAPNVNDLLTPDALNKLFGSSSPTRP